MSQVSVNTNIPTPYLETNSKIYQFKRKLTYSFAFKLLKKHLSRKKDLSFLEVGTGSGFFLQFANAKFPNSTFTGLEYDERLLEATKSRAPFADCYQGNAENFNFDNKTFDVIVSFQVIEHLYNPEEMLVNVHRHLKPGGLFLVTSPNLDGIGAKVMKKKWHGYRDDHVNLKGVNDWNNCITSNGFTQIYSGSTFFSGVPLMNKLPLGILNWTLLLILGSAPWSIGESYVGLFKRN